MSIKEDIDKVARQFHKQRMKVFKEKQAKEREAARVRADQRKSR